MNPLLSLILGCSILAFLGWLFWPNSGLYWRWQERSRRTDRVLLEDTLKHIYLSETRGRTPTLESLAGALSITTDRASEIIDSTDARGLVEIKGERFSLTSSGLEAALQIVRAHRVWEKYLAEFSGFKQEDWHGQAERWEHALSQEEVNRISASLGYPTHDPHGDPIPTRTGEVVGHGGIPVTDLEEHTTARIVHVEDEPEAVYAQIVAEELHPGMAVEVDEILSDRVRLWSPLGEHVLAPIVARNLSVVPYDKAAAGAQDPGVPLSSLDPGESGRVLSISYLSRGMDRRRLLDFGVIPGTKIDAVMDSPGKDPTAYRIRGSLIALRDTQARKILIQPLPESNTPSKLR